MYERTTNKPKTIVLRTEENWQQKFSVIQSLQGKNNTKEVTINLTSSFGLLRIRFTSFRSAGSSSDENGNDILLKKYHDPDSNTLSYQGHRVNADITIYLYFHMLQLRSISRYIEYIH